MWQLLIQQLPSILEMLAAVIIAITTLLNARASLEAKHQATKAANSSSDNADAIEKVHVLVNSTHQNALDELSEVRTSLRTTQETLNLAVNKLDAPILSKVSKKKSVTE